MTALRQATYSPAVFNVGDIEQAKRIILTTEGKFTTDERWRVETPYLLSLIERTMDLGEDSVVLDYGCGIGRMSKALIERFGCRVVGVDISVSMRALAAVYVSSDKFAAMAPDMLSQFEGFDAALAIWVLQHCYDVDEDVARIGGSLNLGGRLFVVNDLRRIVPTREAGWVNDDKDVLEVLKAAGFSGDGPQPLDYEAMGELIAASSYWGVWRS